MARPTKQGLDYFPFDVGFFGDNNIRILKARYHADGIAVYVKLLCDIYKEGYYLSVGCWEDYIFVIADEIGATPDKVEQIITFLRSRAMVRIFGKDELTGYDLDAVITSHGIQARYAVAVKSRRKKSISDIKRGFWLLTDEEETEINAFYKHSQNEGFSENNPDKSENNPDKSENNPVKESKVKEKENICTDVPSARDIFFQTYPALLESKGELDDSAIDYKALSDCFQRSKKYLQARVRFSWVIEHYGEIIAGKYEDYPESSERLVSRDSIMPANVQAVNAKAERERYYSELHAKAERKAQQNVEYVRSRYRRFVELEKEHRAVELDIAKHEVAYARSRSKIDLALVENAKARKDMIERDITKYVELCGLTIGDLVPQWHCKTCNDTGWRVVDGKGCDCYKKQER